MMKAISFSIAMLAAASMVVSPVSPSYAAAAKREKASDNVGIAQSIENGLGAALKTAQRHASVAAPAQPKVERTKRVQVAKHAQRGEAAILSKAQVDRLAVTNPELHSKLMTAYRNNAVPALTAGEKKILSAMTSANLASYKAGFPAESTATAALLSGGGWFVVAFIVIVVLLLLWNFSPLRPSAS